MSGDEIELSFDPCGCGRTTVHIGPHIERYSDKQGDDRITCAATHEVHNEAVNFMRDFES